MILLKMLAVLTLMTVLIRRRVSIGTTMIASALAVFVLVNPAPMNLATAAISFLTDLGTWNMVITLYFTMCLECTLRTSGLLKEFTASARSLFFNSDRFMLGCMPAFLGLIPSFGGAIFSAPFVKESARSFNLAPHHCAAINFWFRHIWEFANPVVPAMLLASQLSGISLVHIVRYLAPMSFISLFIGYLVLLTGRRFKNVSPADPEPLSSDGRIYASAAEEALALTSGKKSASAEDSRTTAPASSANGQPTPPRSVVSYSPLILTAAPVVINILLIMILNVNSSFSMGLVLLGLIWVIRGRFKNGIRHIFTESIDLNIQWMVIGILYLQGMLVSTGALDQIIPAFQAIGVPTLVVIPLTSFLLGLFTGNSPGVVAIVIPLAMLFSPGDLSYMSLCYIANYAGFMLSPVHICLPISVNYFKADFFPTIRPLALLSLLVACSGLAYCLLV